MIRNIVGSSLIVFASYAAFAETPRAFEAASLKITNSPEKDGRVMRELRGGPGSPDPGRFTFTNVTLKILVQQAYNLKEFQVEGPDWIDSVGFDLVATMPRGTTQEQAAEMLQTLLAERFKLTFHRESRQMPIMALVVGKNGPKMKEVEVPTAPAGEAPPPGPGGPGIRMMMSPDGLRLAGTMTMTQLANTLTRRVGRPVVDQTELSKTYDVDITWMPDERDGANMKMAAMARGGAGGSTGDGPRAISDPAPTLAQALDEKLGLKLEARKSAADMFVIERAEKSPVEN